ncbi:uncharacterized protein LOC109834751 [Asparagus officinalis]|uniref:uncharacterized protein LOC109834751 n=1 Tax=Asparagus officinalis TaxID=4686 RepID=UPI00098E6915|nr:uncharacterized protein LOC109834751 [Asparagus officinalis]
MGESTITLQDVSIILGLRVDGPYITGSDKAVWRTKCERLLGVAPESMPKGNIRLKWLKETFSESLPIDAPHILIEQHAHAYIMHMIGLILFPDSSKDKVHERKYKMNMVAMFLQEINMDLAKERAQCSAQEMHETAFRFCAQEMDGTTSPVHFLENNRSLCLKLGTASLEFLAVPSFKQRLGPFRMKCTRLLGLAWLIVD